MIRDLESELSGLLGLYSDSDSISAGLEQQWLRATDRDNLMVASVPVHSIQQH